MKEFRRLIALILLTMLVGCSIILVSKSTDTTINQRLDEDLDAKVDLFRNDSIKK